MKTIRTMGIVAVVVGLLIMIGAMLPSSRATADTGGIIKPVKQQTLMTGTQSFVATNPLSYFVSAPMFIGDYGAVQFQASVVLTDDAILGPIDVTWTPQFSNQPVSGTSCASVSRWFDATSYEAVAGDWVQTPFSALTSGAESVGFEAAAVGACARMKISIAETGVVFTPTVYGRALNRQ